MDKNIETITGSPQQLLAKSFLDFVMNVVAQETKEERIDDSSLDSLLSDEVKTKVPLSLSPLLPFRPLLSLFSLPLFIL